MKKEKEWLKEEAMNLYPSHSEMYEHPDYLTVEKVDLINNFIDLIDQLDEPEVKQLDKKIKELESYNNELIRDNNQLRNELDNQEVLSQEWIENHSASADTISYYSKDNVPVVTAFNLKGLLMPKQDKPIIPQFVVDWIEEERVKIIDWHTDIPERFFLILGHKLHYTTLASTNIGDWVFGGNEEKLYQALKYGYEVEKEKKYIIKFAPSVFGTPTYGSIGTQNGKKIMQSVYGSQGGIIFPNQYTRREIEEVDSKYMIFAEEVIEND